MLKVVKDEGNLTGLTKWKPGKSGNQLRTGNQTSYLGIYSYSYILKNLPSVTIILFTLNICFTLQHMGFHVPALFWHTVLIAIPIVIFASWSVPAQCTFFTPIPVLSVILVLASWLQWHFFYHLEDRNAGSCPA